MKFTATLLSLLGFVLFSGVSQSQQAQWFDQTSNTAQHLNDVGFSDAHHGFVCGNNGTVLRTTNGGTTWTSLSTGSNEAFSKICVIDSMTAFVFSPPALILGTDDGGTNWFTVSIQGLSNHNMLIKDFAFANDQEGYVVGLGGTENRNALVLKTSNRGANWAVTSEREGYSDGAQPIMTFENHSNQRIFRFDDQSIYMAGTTYYHSDFASDNTVFLSKSENNADAFHTFHQEFNGWTTLDVVDLDFPAADTGFMLTYDWDDGFRLMAIPGHTNLPYFTGSLWDFNGHTPSIGGIAFTNTHEGFIATDAGAFIIRDVFGSSPDYRADSLDNPRNASLSALDAPAEGNVVYFVGPGGAIQKYQKPEPPTSVQPLATNSRVSVRAFPVPASDQVSFEFQMPGHATGTLSIYDSYGRVIARETITSNQMSLDTGKWAAGLYTYQLQSEVFPAVNGQLIIRH